MDVKISVWPFTVYLLCSLHYHCSSNNNLLFKSKKWEVCNDNLKCLTFLLQGKPLFLDKIGTTYYFEWKSLIACHGSALDREHQVPCYVYDGAGKLHDVSGLTNINTPYGTTASDGKRLEFNVCRKVTGGQGRLLRLKKKSYIEYLYV